MDVCSDESCYTHCTLLFISQQDFGETQSLDSIPSLPRYLSADSETVCAVLYWSCRLWIWLVTLVLWNLGDGRGKERFLQMLQVKMGMEENKRSKGGLFLLTERTFLPQPSLGLGSGCVTAGAE